MIEIIIKTYGDNSIGFKECNQDLYKPFIKNDNYNFIPILVEFEQIEKIENKMNNLPTKQFTSQEYLKNVFAGACLITMKYGE